MDKILNNERSWGFSGTVGSWVFEAPFPSTDSPAKAGKHQIKLMKKIFNILSEMHAPGKALFDQIWYKQLKKKWIENAYLEDLEIKTRNLNSLIRKMTQSIKDSANGESYLPTGNIELSTEVLIDDQMINIPQSASISFSLDPDWDYLTKGTDLVITYETYIDVWLQKTLSPDRNWRLNTSYSAKNNQRLTELLSKLGNELGCTAKADSSSYYYDYLTDYGFKETP